MSLSFRHTLHLCLRLCLFFISSSSRSFPSNIWVHTYFSYYAETPRTWWNHSTLTLEVSFQLEVVNQRWVSTRTINLRPAPLTSCSLPFQHGSYFSTRHSFLVRQSDFQLLIGDIFNLLSSGGPRGFFPCLIRSGSFLYCILPPRWRLMLPPSFRGALVYPSQPGIGLSSPRWRVGWSDSEINASCSHSHCRKKRKKPHNPAAASIMCSNKPNNVAEWLKSAKQTFASSYKHGGSTWLQVFRDV